MPVNFTRQIECSFDETANIVFAVWHSGEPLPLTYTYSVRNSDNITVFSETFIFNDTAGARVNFTVPNGTYKVYDNSNTEVGEFTVNCSYVCNLFIDSVTTTPAINGTPTGTITINAVSSQTIEYSLDNIIWQSNNVFSGVSSGTKTVYARDSKGCTATSTAFVADGGCTLSIVQLNVTNEAQLGDLTGSVTSTISGNYGVALYSLNGVTYQSSPLFSGLTTGNYNYYVKDTAGCTQTLAFSVDNGTATFEPLTEDSFVNEQLTISYQPELESWTALHDYFPNHYVSKGNRVFMTVSDSNSIWELNKGNYGSYFGKDPVPFIIRFVVNVAPANTKKFDNLVILCSSKDANGNFVYLDTFQQISCHTSYQNSGDMELVIGRNIQIPLAERESKVKAEFVSNEVRLSIPRDLVYDANGDLFDPNNLVSSSMYTSEDRKWRRQMEDKFLVIELQYFNENDYLFDLTGIKTLFRPTVR